MELTDEEKNEVLAKNRILLEFAGFVDYGGVTVFGPGDGTKKGWHYPDGTYLSMNPHECPNLYGSLDAQEKWLWLKLEPEQLGKVLFEIANAAFDKSSFAEASATVILEIAKLERSNV